MHLLAAGRSFVGPKRGGNPFKAAKPTYLPTFALAAGATAGPSMLNRAWKLPISFFGWGQPEPVKVTQAEPAKCGARLFKGPPEAIPRVVAEPQPRAPSLTKPARCATSEPQAKRVLFDFRLPSRPAGTLRQADRSLESVKVVRNDLCDADLEVVPAAAKTTLSAPPKEERAKERVDYAPSDWSRLARRFQVFSRARA